MNRGWHRKHVKREVRAFKSSPPLNLGTNGISCPVKLKKPQRLDLCTNNLHVEFHDERSTDLITLHIQGVTNSLG